MIGEDHRVVNNDFEGLTGTSSRSALSLMDGVPDSPLNGHSRVKRAVIAFNTFVDCRSTILIGLRGSKTTLPPEGCTIANNIILGGSSPLVRVETAPVGLAWTGNILFGASTGVPPEPGLRTIDPKLARGAFGLMRPVAGSPALGTAEGDFPSVADDIDGQPRGTRKDVGCDQSSPEAPPRAFPTVDEVGPGWMRGRSPSG